MKHLLYLGFISLMWTACQNDSTTTMAGADNDFRVKDTSGVTRIFIADRNGSTVKLDRLSNNEWRINDKYSARPDIMQNILGTLCDVRVRYAINESMRPLVERELATRGIKVEVYEGSRKKTFYVGGETSDQLGTHMYMEGAKRIYVTYVANMEGVLTSRFTTDVNELRSRYFVDTKNLLEIGVEYPTKREHSFRFQAGASTPIEPFYVSTAVSTKPLQTQLLRSFTDNLHLIAGAKYINDLPQKDSLIQTTPFCKITLRNRENKIQNLSVFNTGQKITDAKGQIFEPTDRFYTYYTNSDGEKELILTQITTMKNIMWSYTSFFNEPIQMEKSGTKPHERRFK